MTAEVPKEWKRASAIHILKRRLRGTLGISLSRSQDMQVIIEHPISGTEWIME